MRIVKPSFEIWDRSGDPLELIERAARVAYQSEPKGDPEGFVKRILTRKPPHCSVLEHAWFAVEGWKGWNCNIQAPPFMEVWGDVLLGNARAWRNAIRRHWVERPMGLVEASPLLFRHLSDYDPADQLTVCPIPDGHVFTVNFIFDRGVSHEAVRHRPPSFTQESTRFVDYGGGGIAVIHPPEGTLTEMQLERRARLYRQIEEVYTAERREGISPQIARGVLPTSTKTQIVVTAYWTEWQIIFALRAAPQAHPQMQEVMRPLQQELAARYPEKFSDAVIQAVRDNLG